MQQSRDPHASDPYLTWQDLLDEEDIDVTSQDVTSTGDAPGGWPTEQEHGQPPAPIQLPPDVQALMAEKERLEGEMARLAGHGAPRPEDERMKRMYPVRVHTKESRIEDRRLRRYDEHQRMLKQRVLEKKLVQARERQRQEELEAQRKRRALEAALARVRVQARTAEEEAQRRRKAIERMLAATRVEQRQAERTAEEERKEIEQALVQARWENDRRKALATRARARRREALEQELDLGRRRARAMESTQAKLVAPRSEMGQGLLLQERKHAAMAIESPASSADRQGAASARMVQKKLEDRAWEQARERQREQVQERRRAEQELAARLDRRSKSKAGDDTRA